MEKAKKKMSVPDIGGLLGKISEKREEMPKAPIQAVQPVEDGRGKTIKSKNDKTLKLKNSAFGEQESSQVRPCGRPSAKKEDVEYVKISPRIPKELKKKVDIALVYERFLDAEGNSIKTLDEIVSHALERLLA